MGGRRVSRVFAASFAVVAAACVPPASPPAADCTPIDVLLPPPATVRPELREAIDGVRFVVEPLPNGCPVPDAIDVTAPVGAPSYRFLAARRCDYSVGVEMGKLDPSRRALAVVLMSNLRARYAGDVVDRRALAAAPSIALTPRLFVTPAGTTAGMSRAKEAPPWIRGPIPSLGIPLPPVQIPWPLPPIPPLAWPFPVPGAPPVATKTVPDSPPPPPGPPPTAAPPPPGSPPPGTPGSMLQFLDVAATHQHTDAGWGPALVDVMNHEAPGDRNDFPDHETLAHETTHGINAYIRNERNTTGRRANGFYVMNGRGVLMVEPSFRKSQAAAMVPASLRGDRFALYMAGQTAWDDQPTYVFDEWDAYTNGGTVAVDQWTRGFDRPADGTTSDIVFATLEFTVYALVVGMATHAYDPQSFASNTQLREFLAWNAKRAMDVYRAGSVLPPFQWASGDAYWERLKTSPDAAPLRDFTRQTFGVEWARAVMGF